MFLFLLSHMLGVKQNLLGEKDLWPGLMIYGIHAIRMAGAEDFNAALNGTASYDTPELIEAAAAFKQGRAAMNVYGKLAKR